MGYVSFREGKIWGFVSLSFVEVMCLHHAFLDRLATEPDLRHLKFCVGGLLGPHVIFPYTQDLVAHVASSKKYRRTNPLDS